MIIDDDTPPDATIQTYTPRVVEGERASFVVRLSRTYKHNLRIRVRVQESGDMLTRKADERVHEVRINAGSSSGTLTLRTRDDQTNEKASNIIAVIQNPVTRNVPRYQYNVGTPARATVRVIDNDRPPPVIDLSSDSAQITEGDAITLKAVARPRKLLRRQTLKTRLEYLVSGRVGLVEGYRDAMSAMSARALCHLSASAGIAAGYPV